MGHGQSTFQKLNISVVSAIGFAVLLLGATNAASAAQTLPASHRSSTQQWNACRYELAQQGYSAQRQNDFCRLPNSEQWTCAKIVLKKYHSLELAQDTCLSARASEIVCFTQVLDRNFDPYVAKRVCKLK